MSVVSITSKIKSKSNTAISGECVSQESNAEPIDQIDSLRVFQPFSELPNPILMAIEEMADYRTYRSGESVVSFGQHTPDEFHLIVEGQASLTRSNPQTGQVAVETIGAGQHFGLDYSITGEGVAAMQYMTLTSVSDIKVWIIDGQAFRALVNNRPSLAKALLYNFARELADVRSGLTTNEIAPEQLVCDFLLSLVVRDEMTGAWAIENLPKHREISDHLDLDETDIANVIASLISNNIAERSYPGLIIKNMKQLEELAS